jgi:hypothetical protein
MKILNKATVLVLNRKLAGDQHSPAEKGNHLPHEAGLKLLKQPVAVAKCPSPR